MVVIRLYGRSQNLFRKSDLLKIIDENDFDQCVNMLELVNCLSTSNVNFNFILKYYINLDLDLISLDNLVQSLNRFELNLLASKINIKGYKTLDMPAIVDRLLKLSKCSFLTQYFKCSISNKDNIKRL